MGNRRAPITTSRSSGHCRPPVGLRPSPGSIVRKQGSEALLPSTASTNRIPGKVPRGEGRSFHFCAVASVRSLLCGPPASICLHVYHPSRSGLRWAGTVPETHMGRSKTPSFFQPYRPKTIFVETEAFDRTRRNVLIVVCKNRVEVDQNDCHDARPPARLHCARPSPSLGRVAGQRGGRRAGLLGGHSGPARSDERAAPCSSTGAPRPVSFFLGPRSTSPDRRRAVSERAGA